MEKRYQVFVSSTFVDLQDARQEVMQALLELDCMPSGMELFPAADEDQWSLIKKVIDDSDYYVVVLAGRYGSIGPEGVSYTEMEYKYATSIGKPVIAFVHSDPQSLPAKLCEPSDEGKLKLQSFRELVQGKMCKMWSNPAELGSRVSRSLIHLIKSRPAIGWVRADHLPTQGAMEEILALRHKIEELQKEIELTSFSAPASSVGLANGDDLFPLSYEFYDSPDVFSRLRYEATSHISWDDLFAAVSPTLMGETSERNFRHALNSAAKECAREDFGNDKDFKNKDLCSFSVSDDDFDTIKIQFRALGLISQSPEKPKSKEGGIYWSLTPYGDHIMTRLRAIPKPVTGVGHQES